MAHDREVGGIRCTQVLEALSDFLDGEVTPELRGRIEAHVTDCDWCERFGGRFAEMVGELRKQLGPAEPLSDDLVSRLLDAAERADR